MKVVDETRSIRGIEDKVAAGMIEELIYAAHNELKLIRIMKSWKPWEYVYSEIQEKEQLLNMMNLRNDNPFPSVSETYENIRTNRPERRPSAAVHPEDK
jgi:exonuclease I